MQLKSQRLAVAYSMCMQCACLFCMTVKMFSCYFTVTFWLLFPILTHTHACITSFYVLRMCSCYSDLVQHFNKELKCSRKLCAFSAEYVVPLVQLQYWHTYIILYKNYIYIYNHIYNYTVYIQTHSYKWIHFLVTSKLEKLQLYIDIATLSCHSL